jgi:hypothetical protein
MNTTKVQTKNVKLVGGVMGGRMVAVPRSAETLRIGGFWTYEYAGKEGRQELFAMRPMSRVARRLIYWFIGKHGKDPRVEAAATAAHAGHQHGPRSTWSWRSEAEGSCSTYLSP